LHGRVAVELQRRGRIRSSKSGCSSSGGAFTIVRMSERKKASDYPQELLDLFHEYQHGDIDRRAFLDRAAKFAVGGLSAVALLDSLKPNYVWAQQVPKDD